jgi:hypothetical protein
VFHRFSLRQSLYLDLGAAKTKLSPEIFLGIVLALTSQRLEGVLPENVRPKMSWLA